MYARSFSVPILWAFILIGLLVSVSTLSDKSDHGQEFFAICAHMLNALVMLTFCLPYRKVGWVMMQRCSHPHAVCPVCVSPRPDATHTDNTNTLVPPIKENKICRMHPFRYATQTSDHRSQCLLMLLLLKRSLGIFGHCTIEGCKMFAEL